MPSLRLYGFTWHIASDDVGFLAIFGAAFHAGWFTVFLTPALQATSGHLLSCTTGALFPSRNERLALTLCVCVGAAWIVLIAITGQAIYHMPRECTDAGRLFIATVAGLLVCFVTGFVLECLLIWESCQGALVCVVARASFHLDALAERWVTPWAGCIFEVSKRRRMPLLVTLRLAGAACEVAFCGGHPLLLVACLSCARPKHGTGYHA